MSDPGSAEVPQKIDKNSGSDNTSNWQKLGIWCLRLVAFLVLVFFIVVVSWLTRLPKDNLSILVDKKTLKNPYTQYHIYLRDIYPHAENASKSSVALEQMTEYRVDKLVIGESTTHGDDFKAFRWNYFPEHMRTKVRGIVWDESEGREPLYVYDWMSEIWPYFPLSTSYKATYNISHSKDKTKWEAINDIRPGELYASEDMDTLYAMSKLARAVYVLEKKNTDPGADFTAATFKTGYDNNFSTYIQSSSKKTWRKGKDDDSTLTDLDTEKKDCKEKIDQVSFGGMAYLGESCASTLNDKTFDGWSLDDRFQLKIPGKKLGEWISNFDHTTPQKLKIQVGSDWYTFTNTPEYLFPRLVFDKKNSKQCRWGDLTNDDRKICIKFYDILTGLPAGPSRMAPLCTAKPDGVDVSDSEVYNIYSPLAAYQIHVYELLVRGIATKEAYSPHLPDILITLKTTKSPAPDSKQISLPEVETDGKTLSIYDLIDALNKLGADTHSQYSQDILEQKFYITKKDENYEFSCINDGKFFADKIEVANHIKTIRNFFELHEFAGRGTPAYLPFISCIVILFAFVYRFTYSPTTETVFDRYEVKGVPDVFIIVGELLIFCFVFVVMVLGFLGFELKTKLNNNFSVEVLNVYYDVLEALGMAIFVCGLITVLTYFGDLFVRTRKGGIGIMPQVRVAGVYVALNVA